MTREEAIEHGDFALYRCRECGSEYWSEVDETALCESCRVGVLNQLDMEEDEFDRGGEA